MADFAPESLAAALSPLGGAGQVWVAYSGGLDSLALLAAAAAVRERLPGPLQAVHADHGLHPDSAGWAAHCARVCARLAVPCRVHRLALRRTPGDSLEAAAREARYAAFAALLDPGDLLLAAHTQDDQAETLLLALIRGSGVHGLAAMPRVATLGAGRLVRPLLGVRRAELEAYVRPLGLDWIEDPSNEVQSFDRNYLRHRVLPALRARWPAISATVSRSAAHCAEAADLTDRLAGQALAGLAGERPGTLSIAGLQALDPPLRKAALRLWIARQGFVRPDRAHLARILGEILPARPDAAPLVAWHGCEIRRYRGDLIALAPLPAPPHGLALRWEGPTLELPPPLGTLERSPASSARPLVVRFGVAPLDCRPPGHAHRRPLKKLFQESGIPAWLRPYIPLLFDGELLVGVAGVCRCAQSGVAEAQIRWSGHPWESLLRLRQPIG